MSDHLDIVYSHDRDDGTLPWSLATEPAPASSKRLEEAFLSIMQKRHPDKTWTLVREEAE